MPQPEVEVILEKGVEETEAASTYPESTLVPVEGHSINSYQY